MKNNATDAAAPTRNAVLLAIFLMIVAVGLLAGMVTCVKIIGREYHAFQAVFFRNTIAAVLVVPFILVSGGLGSLRTRRPFGHALRSFSGVVANASFFFAYQRIPLADGMAIALAVPIFATLFAIPGLGEKVGWNRWVAILIGFAGVVVALDPTGALELGSLFALIGTLAWALTIIFVKKLSSTESPYAIVFYYMIAGAAVAACFMPWVWISPTRDVLWLYLGAGIAGGLGQIAMTLALKLAPATIVSPFEYTQIAWAILLDLAIWNVSPSLTTLMGAGIVILTGLYIIQAESRAHT
jgi:drug/metabolite transporter (DMT)-like permease